MNSETTVGPLFCAGKQTPMQRAAVASHATQATIDMTMHQAALTRALKTLDAIGAQYAVQYGNQTFGELTVTPKEQTPSWPRYRRGLTRAHYGPYLESMQPGETKLIPFGEFDSRVLTSNVSSACIHAWGKGSAVTQRDDAAGGVRVLRLF